MTISEYILKKAKEKRARVAIGLVKVTDGIIDSLKRASEFADIVVVGEEVKGFENIKTTKAEEVLPKLLLNKEVSGIVRGNMPAGPMMPILAKGLGYEKILRTAIIKNVDGKEYFFTPASVFEGNTMNERLWMARETVLFSKSIGLEPTVGVLSFGRTNGRSEMVDQNIDEAHCIVKQLTNEGFEAEWCGYRIDTAVKKFNIIVPPDGIVGNFVWRSITQFGGAIDIGDFGLIQEVFVDDSAYWDDYYQPIIFATALVNRKI